MSPTSGRASSGEITRLLHEASAGNKVAFDQLVPLVYDELHRIASNRIRVEPVGHTLTPTALVHEAYLALVVQDRAQWHSRAHFFAVAAQAMRRILINYAKMKERLKRGGGDIAIDLDAAESMGATAIPFSDDQAEDLLTLDAALRATASLKELPAPSARRSQARAVVHRRRTVTSLTPLTSAISRNCKPPKKRYSTMAAPSGLNARSSSSAASRVSRSSVWSSEKGMAVAPIDSAASRSIAMSPPPRLSRSFIFA